MSRLHLPPHRHENPEWRECERCVYNQDLLGWYRVENMRLMRQANGSEMGRRDQRRDFNRLNGALYRALAAVTGAENLLQARQAAAWELRKRHMPASGRHHGERAHHWHFAVDRFEPCARPDCADPERYYDESDGLTAVS